MENVKSMEDYQERKPKKFQENLVYCSQCGNSNANESLFCKSCGYSIKPVRIPSPNQFAVATNKSDGYAIASMVIGIISFFGGFILIVPPILAIIFGHISLRRIKYYNALSGKGMAITGLILGYILISFFLLALLAEIIK